MKDVNRIINESGISKVRIARYLGVSRQMLYNYLAMDNFDEMPKEKANKLLSLLGINEIGQLGSIKISNDYFNELENRLNCGITDMFNQDTITDLKGLSKKEQEILTDIFNILKEKLLDPKNTTAYDTLRYLYHCLQAMETGKEIKYLFAYMSKSMGVTPPLEFVYDEEGQYIFEGIVYSAMSIYNNGSASKTRVTESHKCFERYIESQKEEKLSRTQELNSFKTQALKELNYSTVTQQNAKEVFEKIAEIMSRKI